MDATTATVDQVKRLVGLLPDAGPVPLFVFDAGYDPIAIGHDLAGSRAEVLCRVRDDRVLYADPPPRANRPFETGGRPPRHGRRFKCSDPTTWPEPDAHLVATDRRYGTVTVTAWHEMHPKLSKRGHWTGHQVAPIVKGSVIRVEVEHLPKPTARAKKTLWLWWSGDGEPDLEPVLAVLPPQVRHRAHLPLREGNARLDHTVGVHTPTGRPLDLAGGRRLHRAPPGSWPGR